MKLRFPKKPMLLLLASCCGIAPITAGMTWYLGWTAFFPSIASVLPWPGLASEEGDEVATSTHKADESESVVNFMLDKVALQKEIEAQAESLSQLRLPLQTLLDSQTALAHGKAEAEDRHKQARDAIDNKIKAFDHRTLSSHEVELLATYVFSGGEPFLVESLLHSLEKDPPNKALLESGIAYVSRDLKQAGNKLNSLDLGHLSPPVLSRVLLVQSQTASTLDAAERARLLVQAAGLAPGTLVEEASIRRLIQLWSDVANARQLMRWSRHYLRRFPKSYYQGDFAKSFKAGILKAARRGDIPRKDDIESILRSLEPADAGEMALHITKSSVDSGFRELCITFADAAAQILPKTSLERNAVLIHGLACKAAEMPAMVLEELADPGLVRSDAVSRQVLLDAQALASNILAENSSRIPRTPGEVQYIDKQLEDFAASAAQQLKSSFGLLRESKK
jgi:chemotaxis protein MotC